MKAYRFTTGGYIASEIPVPGVKPLHRAIFADDGVLLSLEATIPGTASGDGARDASLKAYRTVPGMFPEIVAIAALQPHPVEDLQGCIAAHQRYRTAWWNQ